MIIGLLSDTHGFLDPKVFSYFENCDELWHAGDLGENVAEQLEKFKPLKAVYGNIDSPVLQRTLPEDLWIEADGLRILITHIAGAPPNYNPRIKRILKGQVPDVLICGHSHILRVARDPNYKNMLFLNPGAAGNQGFHNVKTIMRFEITAKQIKNLEVIEIGKRGMIPP
jgi:uncharacterized protein